MGHSGPFDIFFFYYFLTRMKKKKKGNYSLYLRTEYILSYEIFHWGT
jgi:hypothetical protein